jgi:hypothetical protein
MLPAECYTPFETWRYLWFTIALCTIVLYHTRPVMR